MRGKAAELRDLVLLAGALALVSLVWLVFLGWRPGLVIGDGDVLQTALPFTRELYRAAGDWSRLVYRPGWMGGAVLAPVMGTYPALGLARALGWSEIGALNFAVFLAQGLLAFFAVRATDDLLALRAPGLERSGRWLRAIAVGVAASFSPFVGWRYGFGDVLGFFGALAFPALFAQLAAELAARASVTLFVATAAACALALCSLGQQHIVYGLTFGAPILAGLYLSARPRPRHAGLLTVVALLSAAGLVWPRYFTMLHQALSGDNPRDFSATAPIAFSSMLSSASDWLGSLLWTRAFSGSRSLLEQHELQIPLGLFLVGALLPLGRLRRRQLELGLALSALLALAFSMNLAPVSTALVSLLPPLAVFRVPARAMWPVALTLPCLCTAGLAIWSQSLRKPVQRAGVPLALAFVAGASLWGFAERIPPYQDGLALLETAARVGREARAAEPGLSSPLTRIHLFNTLRSFDIDTGLMADLPGIEAYWPPLQRYSRLVLAIYGAPFDPGYMNFHFTGAKAGEALAPLYNVGFALHAKEGHAIPTKLPGGAPLGPAWFPRTLQRIDSWPALGAELRTQARRSATWPVEKLLLLPADAPELAPGSVDAACTGVRIRSVTARSGDGPVEIGLDWPRARSSEAVRCPLVIAMNHSETLRARTPGGSRLEIFPAYGALTGVKVPPGVSMLSIEASAPASPLAWLGPLAGALLLLGGCRSAARRTKNKKQINA